MVQSLVWGGVFQRSSFDPIHLYSYSRLVVAPVCSSCGKKKEGDFHFGVT